MKLLIFIVFFVFVLLKHPSAIKKELWSTGSLKLINTNFGFWSMGLDHSDWSRLDSEIRKAKQTRKANTTSFSAKHCGKERVLQSFGRLQRKYIFFFLEREFWEPLWLKKKETCLNDVGCKRVVNEVLQDLCRWRNRSEGV
jgi:hypothetical protein